LKIFSKPSGLEKHKSKCTCKQLFACSICGEGFQSPELMIQHAKKFHKNDSSFKTTGVFVGKSRVQNKSRGLKTPLGCVYEKCHVRLKPGLNNVNQVLTPQLKKEILLFLKKKLQ
jgi:hypothetical protein